MRESAERCGDVGLRAWAVVFRSLAVRCSVAGSFYGLLRLVLCGVEVLHYEPLAGAAPCLLGLRPTAGALQRAGSLAGNLAQRAMESGWRLRRAYECSCAGRCFWCLLPHCDSLVVGPWDPVIALCGGVVLRCMMGAAAAFHCPCARQLAHPRIREQHAPFTAWSFLDLHSATYLNFLRHYICL